MAAATAVVACKSVATAYAGAATAQLQLMMQPLLELGSMAQWEMEQQ